MILSCAIWKVSSANWEPEDVAFCETPLAGFGEVLRNVTFKEDGRTSLSAGAFSKSAGMGVGTAT